MKNPHREKPVGERLNKSTMRIVALRHAVIPIINTVRRS